ncbi:MAG: hypothetical protein IPL46_15760 [Saprospiraceae bacterium]|nr:hypothetical protein [Saprospiraceae bacterium]
MKVIRNFAVLFFAVLAIALWSCGGNNQSQEGHDHEHGDSMEATMHGDGKVYNSSYVCPMHCEGSGSDEAGTCPKCGMNYVAHTDHVKDGHTH